MLSSRCEQGVDAARGCTPDLSRGAIVRLVQNRFADGEERAQEIGFGAGADAPSFRSGALQDGNSEIRVAAGAVLQPRVVEDGFADGGADARLLAAVRAGRK